jgi:hypothetical protein
MDSRLGGFGLLRGLGEWCRKRLLNAPKTRTSVVITGPACYSLLPTACLLVCPSIVSAGLKNRAFIKLFTMHQHLSPLRCVVTAVATLSALLDLAAAAPSLASHHAACRVLPGDRQWPSHADWTRLNETVGGRLIAGKPLAHICHGSDYDAAACADLRQGWTEPPR